MFDGFKISVNNENAKYWKNNPNLEFKALINTDTAECINGIRFTKFDGLFFEKHENKIFRNATNYVLRGSFHKYFNKGLHNYNDFNYNDFKNCLNTIQTAFKLDLKETIIHKLEIGLNIETTTPTAQILKGIIAYKNSTFIKTKIDKNTTGLVSETERIKIKIYDKGKQYKLKGRNILRLEVVFKRNETLSRYDILSLYDLLDFDKIDNLGLVLFDVWNNIIFYDKGIRFKAMTRLEQTKFQRLTNPIHWETIDRNKRYKDKQYFKQLIDKYGTSQTYTNIKNLLYQKWQILTAEKKRQLERLKTENNSRKKATNGNLDNSFQMYPKQVFSKTEKIPQNIAKNDTEILPKKLQINFAEIHPQQKCIVCNSIIKVQRKNKIYCSKKCNNKTNGQKRTIKNQLARELEIKNLELLNKILPKNKLSIVITYKANGQKYSDILEQKELIKHPPPQIFRTVLEITVLEYSRNKPPIKLTTKRAKQLLKNIFNIKILIK